LLATASLVSGKRKCRLAGDGFALWCSNLARAGIAAVAKASHFGAQTLHAQVSPCWRRPCTRRCRPWWQRPRTLVLKPCTRRCRLAGDGPARAGAARGARNASTATASMQNQDRHVIQEDLGPFGQGNPMKHAEMHVCGGRHAGCKHRHGGHAEPRPTCYSGRPWTLWARQPHECTLRCKHRYGGHADDRHTIQRRHRTHIEARQALGCVPRAGNRSDGSLANPSDVITFLFLGYDAQRWSTVLLRQRRSARPFFF